MTTSTALQLFASAYIVLLIVLEVKDWLASRPRRRRRAEVVDMGDWSRRRNWSRD